MTSPSERPAPHRAAGFTLVEVLLAIGLLALAGSLVALRIGAGSDRLAVRQAAVATLAALNDARTAALRRGSVVAVDLGEAVPAPRAGGRGDALTVRGPRRIRFFPEGGADGALIVFARGSAVLRLRVDAFAGTATILRP